MSKESKRCARAVALRGEFTRITVRLFKNKYIESLYKTLRKNINNLPNMFTLLQKYPDVRDEVIAPSYMFLY